MKGVLLALLLLLGAASPAFPQASTGPGGPDTSGAGQRQAEIEAAQRREQENLRQQAEQRRQLEQLRQQAGENRAAAGRLKGQENKILAQLHRLERDLGVTRSRLHGLEERQRRLDRDLGVTQVTLERSRQSLHSQKDKLAARLRNLYKFGTARELEFLLSTRSFGQLLARWDFLVRVAQADHALLEDVEARTEMVQATEKKLEINLDQVKRNARATEAENRRLAQQRQQRTQTVSQIRTQRQAYEAAAAELEKTARDVQALIARLERQRKAASEHAQQQGKAPEPYVGEFEKGRGALEWPVRGDILGRFGIQTGQYGTKTINNGIDIATPPGQPVHAVAKGRVDATREDLGSFGRVIIVNHGNGYYTLYGHLQDIAVNEGQEVQSGQVIGHTGESGTQLKGPVLHFEVRKGGAAVNPEDWLK